jgi:hypothetical protein
VATIRANAGKSSMKNKMLFATLLTPVLFTAGYTQTLGKAKLDQFFDRLTEEREQWQAVNSTLQGIWRALSIPGPANHVASAAPLPQEA